MVFKDMRTDSESATTFTFERVYDIFVNETKLLVFKFISSNADRALVMEDHSTGFIILF